MLMKVLSHPGHCNDKRCIIGTWTCFSSTKAFHLSSKIFSSNYLEGSFTLCDSALTESLRSCVCSEFQSL